MDKEKEKLYTLVAVDTVHTEYVVIAHNEKEAIAKCIAGDFEECSLLEYSGDDGTDPEIISCVELD